MQCVGMGSWILENFGSPQQSPWSSSQEGTGIAGPVLPSHRVMEDLLCPSLAGILSMLWIGGIESIKTMGRERVCFSLWSCIDVVQGGLADAEV